MANTIRKVVMPDTKLLHTHRFIFNGFDNGGEQLVLVTRYYHNGDPLVFGEDPSTKIFLNQEIRLNSYGNAAVFELTSVVLNPRQLRSLVDQLEGAEHAACVQLRASAPVADYEQELALARDAVCTSSVRYVADRSDVNLTAHRNAVQWLTYLLERAPK